MTRAIFDDDGDDDDSEVMVQTRDRDLTEPMSCFFKGQKKWQLLSH